MTLLLRARNLTSNTLLSLQQPFAVSSVVVLTADVSCCLCSNAHVLRVLCSGAAPLRVRSCFLAPSRLSAPNTLGGCRCPLREH